MRMFQPALLALLAVIAIELGLIIVKLPLPAAHAMAPASVALPEDPHDTLKRELANVTKHLASIEQRQISDSRRLLATCTFAFMAEAYGGKYPANAEDWNWRLSSCTSRYFAPVLGQHNNFDVPFGP